MGNGRGVGKGRGVGRGGIVGMRVFVGGEKVGVALGAKGFGIPVSCCADLKKTPRLKQTRQSRRMTSTAGNRFCLSFEKA